MPQNPLSQPVGALMRASLRITPEDSIAYAVARFRENGGGLLPVVADERLKGGITERVLAKVVGEAINLTEAVSTIMVPLDSVAPYATGAEALRKLDDLNLTSLVVIDDQRRVLGLIGAADLFPRFRPPIRPAMTGGMASPWGVYLTTGTVSAGVSKWALVGTGVFLSALLTAGAIAGSACLNHFMPKAPVAEQSAVAFLIIAAFTYVGMRLVPMTGIHAAEHQVIHAIERGEELTVDIVKRMPRVHPRCGTNIGVATFLFLAIAFVPWIAEDDIRFLVSLVVTYFAWKRLGNFVQQHVTTKPATDRQLEQAIQAGKELLERYTQASYSQPNPRQWIWSSGMLPVFAGGLICVGLVELFAFLFHVDLGL